MYNTVKKNPIHLVHHEDGIVHTYKSYESLVANWAHIRRLDIGKKFKIEYEWFKELTLRIRENQQGIPYARYHEYILRDSIGNILDPDEVRAAYNKAHPYRRSWWYYPGTKRNFRSMYRRPRTTQERRWANAWDDEEFATKVRARRNYRNLPNSWDDIPHTDWSYRNWKHYRKHQWK